MAISKEAHIVLVMFIGTLLKGCWISFDRPIHDGIWYYEHLYWVCGCDWSWAAEFTSYGAVAWPFRLPDMHRRARQPILVPLSENPMISVFSFQVSASGLTAFHALLLTGVRWGLAHSGCSQYQWLTKQAVKQAIISFSELPFTFLSDSHSDFVVHWPVLRDIGILGNQFQFIGKK